MTEIDAASNNGVDNIRDLRDETRYTPAQVKKRVFIIDEVHMLSIGAFILYVRFDGRRYAALLNVALAIVATGLLFLPFVPGAYSVFLVVLTHMGWEIALLVS